MLLVIDNYDSFVYNLVQYLGQLGQEPAVVRNDKTDLDTLEKLHPEKIVISPGPGHPQKAGICLEVIRRFSGKVPILGVCLGHQCIGEAFGARVCRGKEPVHGKTSPIFHGGRGIFAGIPQGIVVTRYHSLILDQEQMPEELEVTAAAEDGTVMGIQRKGHPTFGVQFHPESIASEYGMEMLANFLRAN
ncbi:anthranilate synthase component II [Candidatus Formimonas warabiya]|uniref:Anthranilate/aminodeoxychorismate synthase component II n=1 Tax=Formimonas warabiya TaxID=1761012 RepID=A0A3G1KPI9_FORW1|nr:aminodeoxychorismate/anthranilate synthase component II [Candidatus Formimonas warabiya]ATW24384.1 anthranilate/aminodeoxychorismate synthase component II [Candidatus Formimonas warabiya]